MHLDHLHWEGVMKYLKRLHRIRIFLGAPLSTSSAVFFTNFKRCASSLPLLTIADSQICEFLPLAGVSSVCSYGYGLLKSDPPPYSPLETSGLSSQLRFSHRESLSVRRPPPHRFSLYPPNWRMVSALLPSLDSTRLAAGCRALSAVYLLHRRCHSTVVTLAELGQNNLLVGLISPSAFNSSPISQLNNQWGILVFLAIFLKIFDGFIKILTETELLSRDYLSLSKSLSFVHLPVDSSGSSPSPFASSLRSAFPPIFEWKCLSITIAVLLSCVAVRSGPEDTTDFVSAIFRGADWMSTSRYTVTISQSFGNVVNFVLTHPSVALDSLSYYLRAFAIFYVVLSFVWRVLNNFPFNCNLDLDV
ncbi:unnamed protein product [Brassica napus]|uniref:(rape) hypothetical protein n=1 Tax=Brassica napus TaxID=3708 RepID=A0A816UVZ7_BRANA|nr:unnamed protein product [Brassica napus]